jgi:hypothetical protein
VRILFRSSRVSWLVCIFAFAAAGFGLTPAYTRWPWIAGYRGPAMCARVDHALHVVKMQTGLVNTPFFWFSLTDKDYFDYLALARSLRAHGTTDWNFPNLAPGVVIPADSVVLILTEKSDVLGIARNALRSAGLEGTDFTQIRIADHDDSYWMTFVRVSRIDARIPADSHSTPNASSPGRIL